MGAFPLASRQALAALARTRPGILHESEHAGRPFGLAPLDSALPAGGLPTGAVVEIGSPSGLGCATRLALAACAAAQRAATEQPGGIEQEQGWCAWIDPSATLFAPGAARAGVALGRLLVVRPPADAVARIAVRLAASRIFSLVVVDCCGVPGAGLSRQRTRWSTAVRRLALAVEGSPSTVLLLTDAAAAAAEPLPVGLRLELSRPSAAEICLRVSKERHGRIRGPVRIQLLALGY
ncbi:MAG: recombinase A [Deltaproteobacteria bacterium]|nr:recombinase A [Deltaproteobacteria bacterium]